MRKNFTVVATGGAAVSGASQERMDVQVTSSAGLVIGGGSHSYRPGVDPVQTLHIPLLYQEGDQVFVREKAEQGCFDSFVIDHVLVEVRKGRVDVWYVNMYQEAWAEKDLVDRGTALRMATLFYERGLTC